jgi:hypothetical protein
LEVDDWFYNSFYDSDPQEMNVLELFGMRGGKVKIIDKENNKQAEVTLSCSELEPPPLEKPD